MTTRERAESLQEYIRSGRILDAMREFYAPDVQMQENANPPTQGLEPNIEREKQFLSQVKEWKGYGVKSLAADGDTVFVESTIDFIDADDRPVHMEQVSVQRWRDGRIVHERFYYDGSAK